MCAPLEFTNPRNPHAPNGWRRPYRLRRRSDSASARLACPRIRVRSLDKAHLMRSPFDNINISCTLLAITSPARLDFLPSPPTES